MFVLVMQTVGILRVFTMLCNVCTAGVLPIHFASQMRNKGKVYAFGVLPMDIPSLQEKLASQSLQSIHPQHQYI